MTPPLILASQSPRRAQLLAMLGLEFDVLPADVDETYRPGESPPAHVERLARDKASVIAARRPNAIVIGSDTVVVLDGEVLGKPADEDEAVSMLMRLQGREHTVETGVAVVAPVEQPGTLTPTLTPTRGTRSREGHGPGHVLGAVESVQVRFRSFDERTAREYVATREPMDKAGAYGIQGYGATLVAGITGDYFAVMGLPVARTIALIAELGWRYDFRGLETR